MLRRLRDPAVYERLEDKAARLEAGLRAVRHACSASARCSRCSGTDEPVRDFADAQACDTERYGALFRGLLDRGVYVAPSQFEAMFVSLAHGDAEIDATVEAVADVLG